MERNMRIWMELIGGAVVVGATFASLGIWWALY